MEEPKEKQKRSTKGDGSIRNVGRNKWRVTVDFGKNPVTKKRDRPSRVVNGTKADARKVRDQLRREHENGLTVEAMATTTGGFLNEWMENRKASGELTHSTISNYERYIRVWITPYLGSVLVKELKPFTIETWHREAKKDGASPRTVQAAHKVLKQALKSAVRYGLALSNPCDYVKTPKAEERKRGYLVPSEARRMLEVLDSMQDSGVTIAVRLGLATGARRGEVLGLFWRNVDFEGRAVRITQSLAQVDGARKAGAAAKELKTTKTESGKRRIAVDEDTLHHLRSWKTAQADELARMGIVQTKDTPVCCSLYDATFSGVKAFAGQTLDPQSFSGAFARFCDEHGFYSTTGKRLCFHELRHTQATLLISNGEDMVSVSGRMGHSSPSITSDMYGHAMPEKDRECADLIGNIFKASSGKARIIEVKTA